MSPSEGAVKVHERMFAPDPDGWPSITLKSLPPLAVAEDLAACLRAAAGLSLAKRIEFDRLLSLGRFDLRRKSLGAIGGGIEATLTPQPENRFALSVDTEPRGGWDSVTPSLREDLARHRLRFRIAHEIGHSFFYDRVGQRPRRTLAASEAQERWCDRFASALLMPPSAVAQRRATPRSVLSLQTHYDVSLHVAVRAFARVHHDRFAALLVVRGRRPPHVRVQWQKHHGAPAPRWWAGERLQRALTGGRRCGVFDLEGPTGSRVAEWHALPRRQQIIVLA
jgi:hypothetical protein